MGYLGWVIVSMVALALLVLGGLYMFAAGTMLFLDILFSKYTLIFLVLLIGFIFWKMR